MAETHSERDELIGMQVAHTALVTALFGYLKLAGVLTQDEANTVADLALLGVETAPEITPGSKTVARRFIEQLAHEIGGPLKGPAD